MPNKSMFHIINNSGKYPIAYTPMNTRYLGAAVRALLLNTDLRCKEFLDPAARKLS